MFAPMMLFQQRRERSLPLRDLSLSLLATQIALPPIVKIYLHEKRWNMNPEKNNVDTIKRMIVMLNDVAIIINDFFS